MFFNIVKIYQSTQAVLNLAVFQSSFLYKDHYCPVKVDK